MGGGLARRVRDLRSHQRSWERRRVRLPATSPTTVAAPQVHVLVPDDDVPSGGIRVMYRHVDLLNAAGVPATVVHQRAGFRCTWFEHRTRVVDVRSVTLGPADLLVVGELDLDLVVERGFTAPHVVLNQSGYLTWQRGRGAISRHHAGGTGLRGAVVVSDDVQGLLRHAFPSLDVARVRLGIDGERFRPSPRPVARRLSWMPRRGAREAEVVLELLGSRGVLDDWEVVPITGLSHDQVAEELRRSDIFLTLSSHEGFGLPAAEAMACGAYVVGFHGYGGREFFDPRWCGLVETGDLLGVAVEVERAVRTEAEHPGWIRARGRAASAHVLATYSAAHEAADVHAAYTRFLRPTGAGDRSRREEPAPWR